MLVADQKIVDGPASIPWSDAVRFCLSNMATNTPIMTIRVPVFGTKRMTMA